MPRQANEIVPNSLIEEDWEKLLKRIEKGKCIPFLGSEISVAVLPQISKISKELARKYKYPLEDTDNLARVTQFIATKHDGLTPIEEIKERLEHFKLPTKQEDPYEPHRILSELPLPIYVTTNYNNFMLQAIKERDIPGEPKRELCRWNDIIQDEPSVFNPNINPLASDREKFPTPANPVVFHMFGHTNTPNSLVLTEDNYLDFLIYTSENKEIAIPKRLSEAFTQSWLLFIGYRVTDLAFRVLLRSLVRFLKKNQMNHVSVQFIQVEDSATREEQERLLSTINYYRDYFREKPLSITLFWGTTQEFMTELKQRWEEFRKNE